MSGEVLAAAIRLIIVLPLVTAMAYLFIKYILARRSFICGSKRRMRVVEQLPLGPKTVLTIVDVGGNYYLLAQHEKGITVVKELDQLPSPLNMENQDAVTPAQLQVLTRHINSLGTRLTKHWSRE